jgi:UDP-GlcNAc:undecaprenyl-phosphate GlcNAc-1-phosphate transferase
VLAVLPALTAESGTSWSLWWAVPLLVGVPVFDTALAIGRRLLRRRPLFEGDRSHVYDQLVDRGWSVSASTLTGWAAQLVATAVGIGIAHLDPVAAFCATAAAGLLIGIGARRAGLIGS